MEIRQLRAFVAIAESGTFTAGRIARARYPGSNQHADPATGNGNWGKSFCSCAASRDSDRGRRTSAASRATHSCASMMRHLMRLLNLRGPNAGDLRIGSASAMVLTDQLPRILKELRKQHPAAEISVTSGTSEVLVEQILAGELDIAFVSLPVDVRGIQDRTTE